MDSLVIEPTVVAQWHALVQDALQKSPHQLEHELEHYLVNVLMRTTQRPNICSSPLAIDYLEAANLQPREKALRYQDIGDQCLLLSGFWPERAQKRLVDTPYYVKLGRSAYWHAAQSITRTSEHICNKICSAFIALMDVLSAMRDLASPTICLFTELDKWQKLGSKYAAEKLRAQSPNLVDSLNFFGDLDDSAAH